MADKDKPTELSEVELEVSGGNLIDPWPTKWKANSFDGKGNDVKTDRASWKVNGFDGKGNNVVSTEKLGSRTLKR